MEERSQENLQPFDVDIKSQLSIYIDGELNQLMFACDWQDNEIGIMSAVEILGKLRGCELFEKILNSILQQCVLQNRLDDFNQIKEYLDTFNHTGINNEIVMRPRNTR